VSEFQSGLVSFVAVLFGLAFSAWGVIGVVGRALDRRAEGSGRVVVRSGLTAYLGVLFACAMTPAGAALVIPLLEELPVARAVAIAFFSIASLLILWRGFVVKIVVDDAGVKVVDYLRTHKLAWSDIVRIGPVRYEEMGTTLGFETRGKGTISPLFLTDVGAGHPRMLEALRRHATVHAIVFEDIEGE